MEDRDQINSKDCETKKSVFAGKNFWLIHENKETTEEVFLILTEALSGKNENKILEILRDPVNARSLIIRRGLHNSYLILLWESFCYVLEKVSQKKFIDIQESELVAIIHDLKLPENILTEILAVAFHLRNEEIFQKIMEVIMNQAELIENKEVYGFAGNILGVWMAEIKGDHEQSVEIFKKFLIYARENNLPVLEQKIIFGMSDHKAKREENRLRPQNQIEDFGAIATKFLNLGNVYDALNAKMQMTKAIFNLSLRQSGEEKAKNEEKAFDLAKKCQKEARDMGYPNVLIQSKRLLAEICESKGLFKAKKRYFEEAEKLNKDYQYREFKGA